jgi:hypothetical protein
MSEWMFGVAILWSARSPIVDGERLPSGSAEEVSVKVQFAR